MITVCVAICAAISDRFNPDLLFVGTLVVDLMIGVALAEALA